MIRLLIADDHALVRGALKQMLALTTDMTVVAEAGHGDELLALLPATPVDVLLLDYSMPGLHGPDLLKRLRHSHPTLPILMLSMHDAPELAAHMLQLGAKGFLSKGCQPEMLLTAVREVAQGRRFLEPALARRAQQGGRSAAVAPHHRLSQREDQILHLLCQGHSIKHIGQHLHISSKTVSTLKGRVMEKLGVSNMADLMRYVIHHGLDQAWQTGPVASA